MEQLDISPIE